MSFFRIILFVSGIFLSIAAHAQSLNNYQYVIVPDQFEFQRDPHDYDLNRMVQFKFNKCDFIAVIDGDKLTDDFSVCDALKASIENKGFIHTNLTLTLKDCNGKVVYTSPKGTSIKKDYKLAYYEAIRNVFKDSRLRTHKYMPVKKPKVAAPKPPKSSIPAVVTQPRPVKPIMEGPKALTGKRVTKTPAKATGPDLFFELRGKQYTFQPQGRNYVINQDGKPIGQATLQPENGSYIIKAGALSGTGVFDDYGNFELNRVNPVTQKAIKDVLARVE